MPIALLLQGLAERFRTARARRWRCFRNCLGAIGTATLGFGLAAAPARDLGQWEAGDPEIRAWYRSLMQPDFPTMSCCGEADAYWADSYEIKDGQYVAIITDPRPDGPLRRPHLEIGTRIVVPNHKLKWDDGNPTGHGVIFLGGPGYVFCYLPPGGV